MEETQMTLTEKWDRRFKSLACFIAGWSSHHGRHIGAVIVGPDREIRATGYNGFPRGVNDQIPERNQKENGNKYLWSLCGERNAIANAARIGVSIKGCCMYISSTTPEEKPAFPCVECAKEIIQAGISELICDRPDFDNPSYGATFHISVEMLKEAGVKIRYFSATQNPDGKD